MADSSSKYSTPGYPAIPFLAFLNVLSSSKSIPSAQKILPSASATPTSLAPASVKYLEA